MTDPHSVSRSGSRLTDMIHRVNSMGQTRHLLGRQPYQHPALPCGLRTCLLSTVPRPFSPDLSLTPRAPQLPGLIHSWYIIAKFPEPGYDYEPLQQDTEGRVYVIVHDGSGRPPQQRPQGGGHQQPQQQPKPNHKPGQPNSNMSYGTTGASAPQQDGGEGSSDGNNSQPPPSYAQVVAGDNKVQTQE